MDTHHAHTSCRHPATTRRHPSRHLPATRWGPSPDSGLRRRISVVISVELRIDALAWQASCSGSPARGAGDTLHGQHLHNRRGAPRQAQRQASQTQPTGQRTAAGTVLASSGRHRASTADSPGGSEPRPRTCRGRGSVAPQDGPDRERTIATATQVPRQEDARRTDGPRPRRPLRKTQLLGTGHQPGPRPPDPPWRRGQTGQEVRPEGRPSSPRRNRECRTLTTG